MLNALKPRALIVALATVVALAATPALADGGDRHNNGHGNKGGYGHNGGHGYKHGNKHGYKHGKKHGHKYGYNNGYGRGYYGNRSYYKPYYGHRPYYRPYGTNLNFTYIAPARPAYETPYYERPVPTMPYVQRQSVIVTNPPVQNQVISASTSGTASCLMTREYQTEIVVGNRVVPGYGQACLQPDGSWLRLPAQPAGY